MRALTTLGSRLRRRLEADGARRADRATTHELHGMILDATPSAPPTAVAMETPTAEQIETRSHLVRLVVEDLTTDERVVLADAVPWRSVEVLGSAALYYAAYYNNPDRPVEQVRGRQRRAHGLGVAIWDIAEARVGIEAPVRATRH